MTKRILIVEDEALLFRRLRNFLEAHNYDVDDYTKSVDEALERINHRKPDLVLLDIHLEGEKTGIDLGKILQEKYGIPFIYLTQHDDDRTFLLAFSTDMEDFISKTKPVLDEKDLLRKIMIILDKRYAKKGEEPFYYSPENKPVGMTVFMDYLKNLKNFPPEKVTEVKLNFDDIAYITTDTKKLKIEELEPKHNYLYVVDNKGKIYFLPGHLNNIEKKLPENFVRIGDGYIINILSPSFEGRINGKTLKILDFNFKISPRYKELFNQRMERFYMNGRKIANN